MEKDLDDCEFWLPPQFLTDDDLLMDFKTTSPGSERSKLFGYGLSQFGSNSDLSSPVESVVGSTENESDEDDYIIGLTRKMVHSTLQEAGLGYENGKVLFNAFFLVCVCVWGLICLDFAKFFLGFCSSTGFEFVWFATIDVVWCARSWVWL